MSDKVYNKDNDEEVQKLVAEAKNFATRYSALIANAKNAKELAESLTERAQQQSENYITFVAAITKLEMEYENISKKYEELTGDKLNLDDLVNN